MIEFQASFNNKKYSIFIGEKDVMNGKRVSRIEIFTPRVINDEVLSCNMYVPMYGERVYEELMKYANNKFSRRGRFGGVFLKNKEKEDLLLFLILFEATNDEDIFTFNGDVNA